MNKDLDERLVPNGEYRDALNIEITSSEGSNVGSAQTLRSNAELTSNIEKHVSAITVGSYVDETNKCIYNFVKDASNFNTSLVGGIPRLTGVRSDLIEKINTKSSYNSYSSSSSSYSSEILIHDVYEVRIAASNLVYSADKLTLENSGNTNYKIGGYTSGGHYTLMQNLRVGMEVTVEDLTGSNAWAGGQRVVVTKLEFDGDTKIRLSSTPAVITNNLEQFVYVFKAPRLLNFDVGFKKQIEINTVQNGTTSTPTGHLITAINVLDDYLLFTDGKNEPKKINVRRALLGNPINQSSFTSYSQVPHTHLVVEINKRLVAKGFLKESHITTIKKNPIEALDIQLDVDASTQANSNIQFSLNAGYSPYSLDANLNQFSFYSQADGGQIDLGKVIYLTPTSSSIEFNINQTVTLLGNTSLARFILRITDVYSDGSIRCVVIDFDEEYFTAYPNEGEAPNENWIGSLVSKSDLYSEKFVRFAYRFRYVDDEYSCVSPYSLPAFLPGSYNFEAKNGFNRGMINTIENITIKNLQRLTIPDDVKAIEFLFKDSSSDNLHAFKQIKVSASSLFGADIHDYEITQLKHSRIIRDFIKVETENFGYTLPDDQLNRTSDAVPIKAKAQEIQANRLMYANYTQGYEMVDGNNKQIDFSITGNLETRDDNFTGVFTSNNTFRANQPNGLNTTTLFEKDFNDDPYIDLEGNQLFVSKTLNTTNEANDSGQNFNSNTGVFTAPVSGVYSFRLSAKAIIRTRTDVIETNSGINPTNFVDVATGAFKGNNLIRRHAIGFGRVNDNGVLKAEFDDPDAYLGSEHGLLRVSSYIAGTTPPGYGDLLTAIYNNIYGQESNIVSYRFVDFGADGFESVPGFTDGTKFISFNNYFDNLNVYSQLNDNVVLDVADFPAEQIIDSVGISNPDNGDPIGDSFILRIGNDTSANYEERFVEIEHTIYMDGGDKLGAFAFTDQPSANTSGDVVQYKDAFFECFAGPAVEEDFSFSLQGLKSIKSDRNYHLGAVYMDENGRESSVVISEENDIFVDKGFSNKQNALTTTILSKAPKWAKTYKVFIKETAVKYHNIVLDGALLNSGEGNTTAYLMFNSADRSKVEIGDTLSIKKQQGTSSSVAEQADFKVLDIQGQATTDPETFAELSDTNPSNVIQVGSSSIETAVITDIAQLNGKFFVKVLYDDVFTQHIGDLEVNEITSGSFNGAVFETKKNTNIDLDLYYEATQAIPIRLTRELAKSVIKPDDKIVIEPQVSSVSVPSILQSFDTTLLKVSTASNFVRGAASDSEVCFAGSGDLFNKVRVKVNSTGSLTDLGIITVAGTFNSVLVKIYKKDGSFISAYLSEDYNPSSDSYIYLNPVIHPTHSHPSNKCPVLLPWFNCYAFGNGVESDTIKDDFNNKELFPYLAAGKSSGFKASLPTTSFEEETKANKIIFSELYNEESNTNRLNEFLLAKDITKTINPDYGSIQKLFSRNNDLLAFCEEKVIRILSQKDALFNADGNMQLTATNKVLGQSIPFKDDFGISKNPESFAYDEYRAYFTDRSRGVVCRLSNNGIEPISNYGMKDWFRDHLKRSEVIIGSFDGRKGEYNITLHEVINEAVSKEVYTVSFNEESNGWTSFKSFIQESGYTLANDYYTIKNGRPFIHHIESNTRNVFYNFKYNSTITPLFNDDASVVKSFKYIAYEGSQSKVNKSLVDGEYYNLKDKDGWFVESIKTDLQEGNISEFLNKEGKWFNYIKGEATKFTNYNAGPGIRNLDLSEFSVQGLGRISGSPTYVTDDGSFTTTFDSAIDEKFAISFKPVVSGTNDDGELDLVSANWATLDEEFASIGLMSNSFYLSMLQSGVFNYTITHTSYAQGPSIAGNTYQIILQPNPGFSINANLFENIMSTDDYPFDFENMDKIQSITFTNQEVPDLSIFSSNYENTVHNGNVIINITFAPGIVLTSDIDVEIPILPAVATGYAGIISTQLTYTIQESQAFQSLLDVSEGIATAVQSTTRGVNYNLNVAPLLADEDVNVFFEEIGSFDVNASLPGEGTFTYLHTITVQTAEPNFEGAEIGEGNFTYTEGKSYIISEDSLSLTLIPSLDDLGIYNFDYEYTNDLYGNLYRIDVHVYYQRFVGQEEALGSVILIDLPTDQIVDYQVIADNYAVPTTLEEDFSGLSGGNFTTVPASLQPHIIVRPDLTQYIDPSIPPASEDQVWITDSGAATIDFGAFGQASFNVQPFNTGGFAGSSKQAIIQLRSTYYPEVTYSTVNEGGNIVNTASKLITQDDAPFIEAVIIAVDGSSVGDTVANAATIQSTPTPNLNVFTEADGNAAVQHTIQLATDTNNYLNQFGGLVTSSVDWIWFQVTNETIVQGLNEEDNGDYFILFNVGNNNTQETRLGEITITHPTDNTLSVTLTVVQDASFKQTVDTTSIQVASGQVDGVYTNVSEESTAEGANAIINALTKSPDPQTDFVQIRIKTNHHEDFTHNGITYGFNLEPSTPYGYDAATAPRPAVVFRANDGNGEWMFNGAPLDNEEDNMTVVVAEEASDAVAWDYQIDQTLAENLGLQSRSYYAFLFHQQNSAPAISLNSFENVQGAAASEALIIQPFADLIFVWADNSNTYNDAGYGALTIDDLDDGDQFVSSPTTSLGENSVPIIIYMVHSGAPPYISFEGGEDFSDQQALQGVSVNGLGVTTGYSEVEGNASNILVDGVFEQVYYIELNWSTNTNVEPRQQQISFWQGGVDSYNAGDSADRIITINQDGKPYDPVNNTVKFVNDAGFPAQSAAIDSVGGTEVFKVIVGDYTQEDFADEILIDVNDASQGYPEYNKRPRFDIVHYDVIASQDSANLDIDVTQNLTGIGDASAVLNVEKNPNFPEGVGDNFISGINTFATLTAVVNNLSGFGNCALLTFGTPNSIQSIVFAAGGNPSGNDIDSFFTLTLDIPLWTANFYDSSEAEPFPNQLVFKFTPSLITTPYDFFVNDELFAFNDSPFDNGQMSLEIVGDDIQPNSIVSSTDYASTGGTLNIPISSDNANEEQTIIIPITGSGNANVLSLRLKTNGTTVVTLESGPQFTLPFLADLANNGVTLNDIETKILGYTHQVSVVHTTNESILPEYYVLRTFHAYNNTDADNDQLNITKKQAETFDFVPAGFTIPDGQVVINDDQIISSGLSQQNFTIFGTDCSLPPIIRFLDKNNSNTIYDPTDSEIETNYSGGAELNAIPYQITNVIKRWFKVTEEPFSTDFFLSEVTIIEKNLKLRFRESLFGPNVVDGDSINVPVTSTLNSSGLRLGIDHQRYFETFLDASEFTEGVENVEINIQTSPEITDGDEDFQFTENQSMLIGAFVTSPYENILNLFDPTTYNIQFFNSNETFDYSVIEAGSTEDLLEIIGDNSLRFNAANREDNENDPLQSNVNVNSYGPQVASMYYDLNIKVPEPGAEYRVSFTLSDWITGSGFGSIINTPEKLLSIASHDNYEAYALNIINIDKHNGTYFVKKDEGTIRIGENEDDLYNLGIAYPTAIIDEEPVGFAFNTASEDLGFFSDEGDGSIIVSDLGDREFEKTAMVGNNHFVNIVRPNVHGPNVDAFITLRFKMITAFTLQNFRIEQVTDAYSGTLTNDPLANGTSTIPLDALGQNATDVYNIVQNAFAGDSQHRFINAEDPANHGSIGINHADHGDWVDNTGGNGDGSPFASLNYNENLQDFDLVFNNVQMQMSAPITMTMQFRSKNTLGVTNESLLAVSVDGGATFLTDPNQNVHGVQNFVDEIPFGNIVNFIPDDSVRRFAVRIKPNMDPNADTPARTFIFALFEIQNTSIDNDTLYKPISSGVPIQFYTVIQGGNDIDDGIDQVDPNLEFDFVTGSVFQ